MGLQGDHSVHVIKLQVMFDWSLEWDCTGSKKNLELYCICNYDMTDPMLHVYGP